MKSAFGLSALLLVGCAGNSPPDVRPAGETNIASVSRMLEWRRGREDLLYIRSLTGRWYSVQLDGRCGRLATADTLGFETSALGQLDRFGAIVAQGERCPIRSVTRIESPPPPSG
jgi:hypothetical protein